MNSKTYGPPTKTEPEPKVRFGVLGVPEAYPGGNTVPEGVPPRDNSEEEVIDEDDTKDFT